MNLRSRPGRERDYTSTSTYLIVIWIMNRDNSLRQSHPIPLTFNNVGQRSLALAKASP